MGLLLKQLEQIVSALKDKNELTKKIEDCARMLLLKYVLQVQDERYDILEIEFYLNNGRDHQDPYAHSVQYPKRIKPIQGVIGSWYFHRFAGIDTYTHTRRGLDLTVGDANEGIYGGILIRSIRNQDKGIVISGPSRVVGELLMQSKNPCIIELAAKRVLAGSAFQAENKLFITERASELVEPVFKSARFGLGNKSPEYRDRYYRFFTHPEWLGIGVKEVLPLL